MKYPRMLSNFGMYFKKKRASIKYKITTDTKDLKSTGFVFTPAKIDPTAPTNRDVTP